MKKLTEDQTYLLSSLIKEEYDNTRDSKKEKDLINLASALGLDELAAEMQQTLDENNFPEDNMDDIKEYIIK